MPKKTIYVREEDIPIFEEAMQRFGGEESMSSVIVDALRERLRDRKKEKEEALHLALVAECFLPPILAEGIERRLRDFPEDVVAGSRIAAQMAYLMDSDFFVESSYWELDEGWLEAAKEKAIAGARLLREIGASGNTRLPEIADEDKEKLRKAKVMALLSDVEALGETRGAE